MNAPLTRPLPDDFDPYSVPNLSMKIETKEGGSTSTNSSAKVDVDKSVNKSIDNSNKYGPWITIIAILSCLSLGISLALLLFYFQLVNLRTADIASQNEDRAIDRTAENEQTSSLWRIDNHWKKQEIDIGVMQARMTFLEKTCRSNL